MRKINSIISVVLTIIAYFLYKLINADQADLNLFSYIGTVATIIGLFIAISEIIHSVRTTKSIQEKSIELLNSVKAIENASALSDCISSIDTVNRNVFEGNYDAAIINYQMFRKICVKVVPHLNERLKKSGLNELGEIELRLLKATKTKIDAPLGNAQRKELFDKLLLVKQQLEMNNPVIKELNNAARKN